MTAEIANSELADSAESDRILLKMANSLYILHIVQIAAKPAKNPTLCF